MIQRTRWVLEKKKNEMFLKRKKMKGLSSHAGVPLKEVVWSVLAQVNRASAELRIKKTQHSTLSRKFVEVSSHFCSLSHYFSYCYFQRLTLPVLHFLLCVLYFG